MNPEVNVKLIQQGVFIVSPDVKRGFLRDWNEQRESTLELLATTTSENHVIDTIFPGHLVYDNNPKSMSAAVTYELLKREVGQHEQSPVNASPKTHTPSNLPIVLNTTLGSYIASRLYPYSYKDDIAVLLNENKRIIEVDSAIVLPFCHSEEERADTIVAEVMVYGLLRTQALSNQLKVEHPELYS